MVSTISSECENTTVCLSAPSRRLDDRLQRVPGPARKRHHRVDLGLRHFPRVDAGHAAAVHVHLHHDPVGLGRRLLKQRLEHVHDEIHRRVVVVQQHDAVQRRFLGLVLDALLDCPVRVMTVCAYLESIEDDESSHLVISSSGHCSIGQLFRNDQMTK